MAKKDWTNKDLEESIKRAFVGKRADSIIVDGHTFRNHFLVNAINYGVKKGILDNGGELIESDQWAEYHYRLTTKGKKYFGLD